MVCRELQPASELSAVNVAVKYHDRCIEREGELPTLDTKKYARDGKLPCRLDFYGPLAQLVNSPERSLFNTSKTRRKNSDMT